jgi:DAACS family dicarboxylate/amino acid:cation (Na+ or H+) symporter
MSAAKAVKSTAWILVAIGVGIVTGYLFGKSCAPLGNLGKFYIQLIKAFAAPLLFFAVIDAIVTSEIKFKNASRFLGVVSINTIIAATIGIGLANLFQPGKHLTMSASNVDPNGILSQAKGHSVDFLGFAQNFFPANIIEPFTNSNVIGVVCLAVLLGCALKNYQSHNEPWVEQWNRLAHGGYRLSETIITWLVTLTPVAVFGVIAKSVGESGLDKFQGLAAYVGVALLGLCIQTFVVYNLWLILTKKVSLKDFWREASRPCLNAFGVNSSLATLPLTLKALDNLKVSKTSSRMAACIGTNLNNDGILLYEAMAAIIVTQALGMNLTISSQISIALVCVLTSLGIAGVPEAGIISLAIILSTLGIPNEIVTSFLAVDWIIARMRSVTNVVADMTSSIVIDQQSDRTQGLSNSS